MFAKIKDSPGFVRNIISEKDAQPILNVNTSGLAAYKKTKNREIELNSAIADINTLKTDIDEIKKLLIQLTLK